MDRMNETSPFDAMEDRILPWSQVKVICGLSRTTVWRMQKTGDFPACVQVSRNRVGWWQSELLAWHRARTPRRLPEPRQPAPTGLNPKSAEPLPRRRQTPVEPVRASSPDPAKPPQAGRRKRKAGVPENQTAFDFGG